MCCFVFKMGDFLVFFFLNRCMNEEVIVWYSLGEPTWYSKNSMCFGFRSFCVHIFVLLYDLEWVTQPPWTMAALSQGVARTNETSNPALCLPGRQPPHQGWLLPTILPQEPLHPQPLHPSPLGLCSWELPLAGHTDGPLAAVLVKTQALRTSIYIPYGLCQN